jgi:hypothetical protein
MFLGVEGHFGRLDSDERCACDVVQGKDNGRREVKSVEK